MWDDTESMFGENRPYIIHYFLSDDTVEVREVYKQNDGRDPFPILIKRQRLPKTFVDKKSKFRLVLWFNLAGRRVPNKAALSLPLINSTGKKKHNERLMGRDKDRERSLTNYCD